MAHEKLRQEMIKKNVRQRYLYERLKITQATFSNKLRNETFNYKELKQIIEILNISPEVLF